MQIKQGEISGSDYFIIFVDNLMDILPISGYIQFENPHNHVVIVHLTVITIKIRTNIDLLTHIYFHSGEQSKAAFIFIYVILLYSTLTLIIYLVLFGIKLL